MSGPVKAWVLPSAAVERTSVLCAALARARAREESGAPRNRAWIHCRRWHRRWQSGMYVSGGKPHMDCSRCGLRWTW